MPDLALEVQDLRVDYGDFTAVKDVSFSVECGEIYGLVGPNGAGKTSTLNVLATLLQPTYGNVKILGIDIDLDPNGIRNQLGYMPDLAPTIKNLKVWEFLDLYAASHGIKGETKKRRVSECLEKVKLEDRRNVFCGTLSRGMTQRVVLAKTLIHSPKLLLLDEPASGMDPMARIDLKNVLREIAKDGAAVILSSHILTELAEMATSVGILHNGEMRYHGPVESVLATLSSNTREVRLRTLGEPEACVSWLRENGFKAEYIPKSENGLSVLMDGSLEDQANLLKELVHNGFPILEFNARQTNLEDILQSLYDEQSISS